MDTKYLNLLTLYIPVGVLATTILLSILNKFIQIWAVIVIILLTTVILTRLFTLLYNHYLYKSEQSNQALDSLPAFRKLSETRSRKNTSLIFPNKDFFKSNLCKFCGNVNLKCVNGLNNSTNELVTDIRLNSNESENEFSGIKEIDGCKECENSCKKDSFIGNNLTRPFSRADSVSSHSTCNSTPVNSDSNYGSSIGHSSKQIKNNSIQELNQKYKINKNYHQVASYLGKTHNNIQPISRFPAKSQFFKQPYKKSTSTNSLNLNIFSRFRNDSQASIATTCTCMSETGTENGKENIINTSSTFIGDVKNRRYTSCNSNVMELNELPSRRNKSAEVFQNRNWPPTIENFANDPVALTITQNVNNENIITNSRNTSRNPSQNDSSYYSSNYLNYFQNGNQFTQNGVVYNNNRNNSASGCSFDNSYLEKEPLSVLAKKYNGLPIQSVKSKDKENMKIKKKLKDNFNEEKDGLPEKFYSIDKKVEDYYEIFR